MPEGDALATTSSIFRPGAIENVVLPKKRIQTNPFIRDFRRFSAVQ